MVNIGATYATNASPDRSKVASHDSLASAKDTHDSLFILHTSAR